MDPFNQFLYLSKTFTIILVGIILIKILIININMYILVLLWCYFECVKKYFPLAIALQTTL